MIGTRMEVSEGKGDIGSGGPNQALEKVRTVLFTVTTGREITPFQIITTSK